MRSRRAIAAIAVLATSTFALLGPAPTQAQQDPLEPGWVSIALNGRERVGLAPRPEPYLEGGPRVKVPIPPVNGVEAKDGRPVALLEAIAWREGGGARVMVWGLSQRGATASKRFLGSTLLPWGSTSEFAPLEELGIGGVSVMAGAPPDR